MFTKIRPCGHFRKGADDRDKLLCLLDRHLDDGEPFIGILLVPDTVDVNGARSTDNLVALLLQIGEELDIVVIEFLIRAEDLQTGSLNLMIAESMPFFVTFSQYSMSMSCGL